MWQANSCRRYIIPRKRLVIRLILAHSYETLCRLERHQTNTERCVGFHKKEMEEIFKNNFELGYLKADNFTYTMEYLVRIRRGGEIIDEYECFCEVVEEEEEIDLSEEINATVKLAKVKIQIDANTVEDLVTMK